MTSTFAWICAGLAAFGGVVAVIATLGSAYFFDKSAEEGIAEANEKAAHANHLAAEANERAAALAKEAAQLRADNLTLEQTIAPRRWYGPHAGSIRGGATGAELFDRMDINNELFRFPKTKVLIQHVPEFEAEKLAIHIQVGLTVAGWMPQSLSPEKSEIPPHSLPDGVEIWTRSEKDDTWHAAEALANSLASEGIQAGDPTRKLHQEAYTPGPLAGLDIRNRVPEGTIVLLIGEKPGYSELLGKLGQVYRDTHPNEK